MSCLLLLMIASQFFLLSTYTLSFFVFVADIDIVFLNLPLCLWSPYFFSLSPIFIL